MGGREREERRGEVVVQVSICIYVWFCCPYMRLHPRGVLEPD